MNQVALDNDASKNVAQSMISFLNDRFAEELAQPGESPVDFALRISGALPAEAEALRDHWED